MGQPQPAGVPGRCRGPSHQREQGVSEGVHFSLHLTVPNFPSLLNCYISNYLYFKGKWRTSVKSLAPLCYSGSWLCGANLYLRARLLFLNCCHVLPTLPIARPCPGRLLPGGYCRPSASERPRGGCGRLSDRCFSTASYCSFRSEQTWPSLEGA